jgi:hypothetical protein
VVLVRWWTAPGRPYCAAPAPALNEFHARYKGKGLVVVGLYHHKADAPLDPAQVKRSAEEEFGFRFPVAIDRRGVVRHVHPGGQYARGGQGLRRAEGEG